MGLVVPNFYSELLLMARQGVLGLYRGQSLSAQESCRSWLDAKHPRT